MADAVQRIEDPSKRAALLSQVLGKSYQELVPLLSQGGAELRKSAQASETFADAMARLAPNADAFNDSLTSLKINAAGLSATILADLVPSLSQYLGALTEIVNQGSALDKLKFFTVGYINPDVADKVTDYATRTTQLREEIKRLQDAGQDASEVIARLNKLISAKVTDINRPPARVDRDAGARALCEMDGGTWKDGRCIKKRAGGSTSKADPFAPIAGLLAGTDVGKLKDFDEKVGLLNRKLSSGAIGTEQYTQAMTALIETTFANNFKQAAEDAEFFRAVEADGIKTTQEWKQNLDDLANVDMGRLNDMLANTDFARLKKDQDDMILLAKAFTEGIKDADGNLRKLSEAEYLDATKNRLGLVGKQVEELDTFAKNAAKGMQGAFADFLFDPFNEGLDGMLQGFGTMVQRMIAEAVAADLARNLFGNLVKGGTGDGLVGGALSAIGGAFDSGMGNGQNLLGDFASLFGFDGGGYTGDGPRSGGLDGKGGFLAVMHPRETVVDHTRGQAMGGGNTYVVHVHGTNNAQEVKRAAGQGMREAIGFMEMGRRYV